MPSEVEEIEAIKAILHEHLVPRELAGLPFVTGIPEAAAAIAALRSQDRGARESDIRRFATAILHGDDEHRGWLTEAAECFVSGTPLPAPRGKGTQALPLSPVRTEDGDA